MYSLRVNLSVALVAMLNSSAVSHSSASNACIPVNSSDYDRVDSNDGEFNWDPITQGIILGGFFWGYLITQIPGGILAERFGSKILIGVSILLSSVMTLLTPVASRMNRDFLIALRVLEGIAQGVVFPAMQVMWSKWAPALERSRLIVLTYSGCAIGTVVTMALVGLLCDSNFLGGWPSAFYVFGGFGCIWFVLWMFLAYDTPADHPRISEEERHYIESSVPVPKKRNVPWLLLLSSRRFWAIVIYHVCHNCVQYTLLTTMSIFIMEVLHFEIRKNGLVSSLPHLANGILYMLGGVISDFLRKKRYLSTTNTRKLMVAVGTILPATFLMLTGYTGCNSALAIVYLTCAVGIIGFAEAGFMVNIVDIAPAFAGTVMGLTNTFGTIPGIAGPYVVGLITNTDQSIEQWRIIFFIASGIHLFGAVFYLVMGSGEIQSWAMDDVMNKEVAIHLMPSKIKESNDSRV